MDTGGDARSGAALLGLLLPRSATHAMGPCRMVASLILLLADSLAVAAAAAAAAAGGAGAAAAAAAAVTQGGLPGSEWAVQPSPMLTRWAKDVRPEQSPPYPRPQLVRPTSSWQHLNGLWSLDIRHGQSAVVGTLPPTAPAQDGAEHEVLVPYPLEAPLSGVRALPWSSALPGGWPYNYSNINNGSYPCAFWYSRNFTTPQAAHSGGGGGQRVVLHFEAVMASSVVFLNGVRLGQHRGGYDDFSFDITQHLRPTSAGDTNVLQVGVLNDAWFHGKQFYKHFLTPGGIAYSSSSGIWQTVWLEFLPLGVAIEGVVSTTLTTMPIDDVDQPLPGTPSGLHININLDGLPPSLGMVARVRVHGAKSEWGSGQCEYRLGRRSCAVKLEVPAEEQRPWVPADPYLYNLTVTLATPVTGPSHNEQQLDTVESYAALRTVGRVQHSGITRLLLNGRHAYLIGTLDQGFWPDGVYTAPTDEALAADLVTLKQLGFNALRKHQKVEPRRFYYHCDRLGIAVIQDFPGGHSGFGNATIDTQFRTELRQMVRRTAAHPSVIAYSIYNEGNAEPWNVSGGAEYIASVVAEIASADSTSTDPESNARLIDAASGWHQADAGTILSSHSYDGASVPNCSAPGIGNASAASSSRGHYALEHCAQHVLFNSEFGGLCLAPSAIGMPEWFDAGHEKFFGDYKCAGWGPTHHNPTNCTQASSACTCSHGYGVRAVKDAGNNAAALSQVYANITSPIATSLIPAGVSANIYTQTSDVETEADGLLSYDRVLKVDPAIIRATNQGILRVAARFFATLRDS